MTQNLKGLSKRQTFWDLRCSSRSLGTLFLKNEKQKCYSFCIFPRDVLGPGGEQYDMLQMIGINIDFQTGEEFEILQGETGMLHTL